MHVHSTTAVAVSVVSSADNACSLQGKHDPANIHLNPEYMFVCL